MTDCGRENFAAVFYVGVLLSVFGFGSCAFCVRSFLLRYGFVLRTSFLRSRGVFHRAGSERFKVHG